MIKRIDLYCLSVILMLLPAISVAQSPQYLKISPSGPRPAGSTSVIYGSAPWDSLLPRRFQTIYQPKYFSPAPPVGYIKYIYFNHIAGHNADPNGVMYDVEIKMGYTKRDSFKFVDKTQARYVRDTFITGLTSVFKADSLVFDHFGQRHAWLKLPLGGPGFFYTGSLDNNLVLELSFGSSPWIKWGVAFSDSISNQVRRTLAGYRDSVDVAIHRTTELTVGTYTTVDFGFDLVPGAAVHEPAISIGELYPNPASSLLNIPVKGHAGAINVRISTVEGKIVSTKQYTLIGAQSTLSIRIKDLPPGNYLVGIDAGDEVVQRKFTKL